MKAFLSTDAQEKIIGALAEVSRRQISPSIRIPLQNEQAPVIAEVHSQAFGDCKHQVPMRLCYQHLLQSIVQHDPPSAETSHLE